MSRPSGPDGGAETVSRPSGPDGAAETVSGPSGPDGGVSIARRFGFALFVVAGSLLAGCQAEYAIPPGQLHADVEAMFAHIERTLPGEMPEGVAPFRAELKRRIDAEPMGLMRFWQAAATPVASLGIGHTMLRPPEEHFEGILEGGGKVYPLAVTFADRRAYIAAAYQDAELPLGAEILRVNGRPAREAFASLARYFPRPGGGSKVPVLERPWLLWMVLWLHYGQERPLELVVRPRGTGPLRKRTLRIAPVNGRAAMHELGRRRASPVWADYRFRIDQEHNAGVLTINAFSGGRQFMPLVHRAFSRLEDAGIPRLVIDLRENPGGSVFLAEFLMEYLTNEPYRLYEWAEYRKDGRLVRREVPLNRPKDNPRLFGGELFVLTGPRTGSAAAAVAAAVKHYGLGTVVGRAPGDPRVMHGNPKRRKLSHTALTVLAASVRAACVGAGVATGPLQPDIAAPPTPRSLAAGEDPALDYALTAGGAKEKRRSKNGAETGG